MDLGYRGRGRGVGRERVVRSERQMAVTSGHFAPVLHLETCLRGGVGKTDGCPFCSCAESAQSLETCLS